MARSAGFVEWIKSLFAFLEKKNEENFDSISDITNSTSYCHPYSAIGEGTRVIYRLEAVDNVGNTGIIAEDSIRCLLGPYISSEDSITFEDSIILNWGGFDIDSVSYFEVYINDIFSEIINDTNSTVSLTSDDANRIKARAFFEKINGQNRVFSIWSNTVTVVHPDSPKVSWVVSHR